MSNLVAAFLNTVGKASVEVIDVPEIGTVGVRTSMLLSERAEYVSEQKGKPALANAMLLRRTVCDPETHELIFNELTIEQINQLPTYVADPMIEKALKAIGVKTEKLDQAVQKEMESEELKNSGNDQN